jgi:phytoene synthase
MTEASLTPDRRIAIASAPQGARHAFAALLGLDQRLGDIVRAARDPMIGQMRLTWWHEALGRLDSAPAPAEPLLRDLATHVVAGGIRGTMLADLVEGWEVLLDEVTNQESLGVYARGRGGLLFDLGTRLLRSTAEPYVGAAGQAWALADLANGSADGRVVQAARGAVAGLSCQAFAHRWPAPIRPLGILAKLAIAGGEPGNALAKSMAIARFRLIGR